MEEDRMEKPIPYEYRIQYEIRNDHRADRSKNGTPHFWIEKRSFIGSSLDGEWSHVGVWRERDGYDPDWGRYTMPYVETTYYETSDEAERHIHELLSSYPDRLRKYEEWAADAKKRLEEKETAEREALQKRLKFEAENSIGKVFK